METKVSKSLYFRKILYTRLKLNWVSFVVVIAALIIIHCNLLATYYNHNWEFIQYNTIATSAIHVISGIAGLILCILYFNRWSKRHNYSINCDDRTEYLVDLTILGIIIITLILIDILLPIIVRFFAYLSLSGKGLIGGEQFVPLAKDFFWDLYLSITTIVFLSGIAFAIMQTMSTKWYLCIIGIIVIVLTFYASANLVHWIFKKVVGEQNIIENIYKIKNVVDNSIGLVFMLVFNVISRLINKKVDFVR